jgi:hypothetical protein
MYRNLLLMTATVCIQLLAGPVTAGTVQVKNDKKITEGMGGMVFLKVVDSQHKCSYAAELVQLRPGTDDAQWVLKARKLTCMGAKDMSINISDAKALVLLNTMPVPANTTLELHDRTTE